jgi:hypothetical protein
MTTLRVSTHSVYGLICLEEHSVLVDDQPYPNFVPPTCGDVAEKTGDTRATIDFIKNYFFGPNGYHRYLYDTVPMIPVIPKIHFISNQHEIIPLLSRQRNEENCSKCKSTVRCYHWS